MLNDLSADTSNGLFKYVDDTSLRDSGEKKSLVMHSPSSMRYLHGLPTSFNFIPVNVMSSG